MMTQANREVVPRANQQVATIAYRLKYLTMMNPPSFYGSKVEKYPYEFIDEIYQILYAMGLSTSEKDELATYKHKYVAHTLHV